MTGKEKVRKKNYMARTIAFILSIALVITGVNLPAGIAKVSAASNATYQPLTVSSGYNADIVATSTSSSSSEYYGNTDAMDNTGKAQRGGCLYSSSANGTTGYLPSDRIISSTATNGLTWKMSSYTGKNALKLTDNNTYRELNFATIGVYQKLYFLCTAGGLGAGNSGTMKAKITYTDGKEADATFLVRDWWDNVNAATEKYKRLDSGSPDGSTSGAPYFTQCEMSVDQTRLIKNVKIAGGSSSMVVCVFGVTGLTADIAAPDVSVSDITSDGFTASWNAVANAASYRLDVATDADFTNIVSSYNNKTVNGTSLKVTGLNSAAKYYVRARAANSAGAQSASSAVKIVTTLGAMKIIYNSNGGTGAMSDSSIAYGQSGILSENLFTRTGYSFKEWNTVADGTGKVYGDKETIKNSNAGNTTLNLYAQWIVSGPVELLNDGYAYGRDMTSSSVKLQTDVKEDQKVGSYEWQYCSDKDAADDRWEAISDKIFSDRHTNQIEIPASKLKDGYWYRCVVNGQTKTKPVRLVKANGSVMNNVTRPYAYGQWYVSNACVAYTSTQNGYFDVLGKYEKNGTYYWLQTSYYGGWKMYTDSSEKPSPASYYSGSCSMDKLRVAFSEDDKFNMKFEAMPALGQKSFAFGCDTMLGNWVTSGSYSDYASLKAVKEGDETEQIQMVGAYSVDTAKATDTSFVLKYVDGYAPTYYWLGRYYNRQVWTNGTLEDVINTDSGMTSSWCDISDGSVKFEFHVGAVADTGAKITICAVSEKDSITIKNPDSSCEYALYREIDGQEKLIEDWKTISEKSYVYRGLESDTKYILKAKKDGEIVSREIYTKIDTETGADAEKIQWEATSSALAFTNLKNIYEYALTDRNGNLVREYTSPSDHEITFTDLTADTIYYLIARSGENELSERVYTKTKNAVICFDKNTSDTVTGMPGSLSKDYGKAAALPNVKPTRTGYTFAGWITKAYKDEKTVMYRAGSYYYGEKDAVLYAVWYSDQEETDESATYTVEYDSNVNGETVNVPSTGTKSWGDPYVISGEIPVRTGYTFKSWNTKQDGMGDSYSPGSRYLFNKDITLYAVWDIQIHKISVEQNERYTAQITGDTVTKDGQVNDGKDAVVTIYAQDKFDIRGIKAYVNGESVNGTLSEDERSYTIGLSGIKEDQYITVSGITVSMISVDKESEDFGKLVEFYPNEPETAQITVTNDGEKEVILRRPVSDKQDSAFIVGNVKEASLAAGDSTTFTVQPRKGLVPGIYTESIIVATTTGARQSVKVTFEVLKDSIAPSGEIVFGHKKWNSLLEKITFGIFSKKTVQVTISGQDEEDGSGLDAIYYYIADKAMTKKELEALNQDCWIEGTECSITPDQKAVIYAKVTDRGGNSTYLCSDGIVVDDQAPVIKGVTDGEELYFEKEYEVSVIDSNLDKVYVTDGQEEYTPENEVEIQDGQFVLKAEREQDKTIIAIDKAGNSSSVKVTFISLNGIKEKAEKEITGKAEEAKKKIDALEDLTQEEKDQMKREIDESTEEHIREIERADDKDQVAQREETGKEDIGKGQERAEKTDLTNAKENAEKEIDKKAKDAKNVIDAMKNLTKEEKETAKKEIDQKAEEAKKAIQNTTEKTQVTNTKTDITTEIIDKVDDAKKNDYDKIKNDTVSGVLTVAAQPADASYGQKKYDISLRVGNTVVEKKSSVSAGEKVSFDGIPDGNYNLVISDGADQRTTYVKVKNGIVSTVGTVTIGNQNTSVDAKLGAPDIAADGLEKIYDTDIYKDNKQAVETIESGKGKVDIRLTAENADGRDEKLENAIPKGKKISRYTELRADMIVTDAEGKTTKYSLSDTKELVLIAMPLSEQEKNRTGYMLLRRHNDETGEKIEELPMLEEKDIADPEEEGFYMDQDYIYIWAHKFSVYALAYNVDSTVVTPVPSVRPTVVPTQMPAITDKPDAAETATNIPSVSPSTNGQQEAVPEKTSIPKKTKAPKVTTAPKKTKSSSKEKDQSKLSGNQIDKLKLPLLLAKGKGGDKKIALSWTRINKATGYECYWSYCDGKKMFKKFKAVTNGKSAVHNKLKNNRKYKYFVVAYSINNGNKIYIAKSPQLHIAMKADKMTNVSGIRINADNIVLRKGKSFRLESHSVLEKAKKKQVLHAREYRYYTSDRKVAVVDKKGMIKAVADGKCTITIMANNGVNRRIRITVSKTAKVTKAVSLITEGMEFQDNATKGRYRITSLKNKTAALIGITDANKKEFVVASGVKYKGTVYRVVSIADRAFASNENIVSVDLPKNIQSVGKAAFKNCKNLRKITIRSAKWKAGSIGEDAFKGVYKKVHVYCMESIWEKYETLVEKANIPKRKVINLLVD